MKLRWAYELELKCRNSIKQIKSSELPEKIKSEKISKIKNETLEKIKDLIYSN